MAKKFQEMWKKKIQVAWDDKDAAHVDGGELRESVGVLGARFVREAENMEFCKGTREFEKENAFCKAIGKLEYADFGKCHDVLRDWKSNPHLFGAQQMLEAITGDLLETGPSGGAFYKEIPFTGMSMTRMTDPSASMIVLFENFKDGSATTSMQLWKFEKKIHRAELIIYNEDIRSTLGLQHPYNTRHPAVHACTYISKSDGEGGFNKQLNIAAEFNSTGTHIGHFDRNLDAHGFGWRTFRGSDKIVGFFSGGKASGLCFIENNDTMYLGNTVSNTREGLGISQCAHGCWHGPLWKKDVEFDFSVAEKLLAEETPKKDKVKRKKQSRKSRLRAAKALRKAKKQEKAAKAAKSKAKAHAEKQKANRSKQLAGERAARDANAKRVATAATWLKAIQAEEDAAIVRKAEAAAAAATELRHKQVVQRRAREKLARAAAVEIARRAAAKKESNDAWAAIEWAAARFEDSVEDVEDVEDLEDFEVEDIEQITMIYEVQDMSGAVGDDECICCYDAMASHGYGCGHVVVCENCAKHEKVANICPKCRHSSPVKKCKW